MEISSSQTGVYDGIVPQLLCLLTTVTVRVLFSHTLSYPTFGFIRDGFTSYDGSTFHTSATCSSVSRNDATLAPLSPATVLRDAPTLHFLSTGSIL